MSEENIFQATEKGNFERIKYLIEGGIFRKSIDINIKDEVKKIIKIKIKRILFLYLFIILVWLDITYL